MLHRHCQRELPVVTFPGLGRYNRTIQRGYVDADRDHLGVCTPDSTTLTAPSITTTEPNSLDLLAWGVVGNNDVSKPTGYSVIYNHDIPGTGPDIANQSKTFAADNTDTADQQATVNAAGDNIGYQVGLSPPLP